jgi:hypothetical protein
MPLDMRNVSSYLHIHSIKASMYGITNILCLHSFKIV